MTIGIYGISSQSGRAFLADYMAKGYKVVGYTRPTPHGLEIVEAINGIGGIHLERPENTNNEKSAFVPFTEGSCVTTDIGQLVGNADVVIVPLPSTAHVDAAKALCAAGIVERQLPIVLSPSRTMASPYMWQILGDRYPIVCFSTCPYSCKAPRPDTSLIKRRKRTYVASLEGEISRKNFDIMRELFPQAAFTRVPALTSLNNIGGVFHCATYMLNIDEIERRKEAGEVFSFYMDGIAARPDVGAVLEQIDQVRLQIADRLGIRTFGLASRPREDIWRKLTNALRALEEESSDDIAILRRIRKEFVEFLDTCVLSAAHWLDLTYGVARIEGESISSAIGRTPTYQKNSVPQFRYVTEDIPTGLVPFESLAKMLGIECQCITDIIDMYDERFGDDARSKGRNLQGFDRDYVIKYLTGKQ